METKPDKFTLEIQLLSTEFEEFVKTGTELAKILKLVADRIEREQPNCLKQASGGTALSYWEIK